MSTVFLCVFVIPALTALVQGFCGDSIRWSHNVNMENVYGMWYGVGHAQHTPDMTNKPNRIGCVTLSITDVTAELRDEWLDWSIVRKNYSDQNWRSYKDNPWSDTPMSGSWLDIRFKRKFKRDIYNERRLRIIWDEDGQTIEQTYTYTPEEPGIWVAEKRRYMEKEMSARGLELWHPDNPPRHPQVIRLLKVTPHMLIINHCSETGSGGIFSLILRRSPSIMKRWEWHEIRKQFYSFELPNIYRYTAVCAACVCSSTFYLCYVLLLLLYTCLNIRI